MNNFLFEAVCSWSSESVRKPSEKAFGKGNTSPCLDRSVKMILWSYKPIGTEIHTTRTRLQIYVPKKANASFLPTIFFCPFVKKF